MPRLLPDTVKSIWMATTPGTNFPALQEDIQTDAVVIGGGIAGLNAAYFLKNRGLQVVVLEAGRVAAGTSGNTTAKVTSLHELKYAYLIKSIGEAQAKKYADSHQWAIAELERIINTEHIACDFHKAPSFTYAKNAIGLPDVEREVEAALCVGLPASFVASIAGFSLKISGAVRFDEQAYFHPRKYLLNIAELVNGNGSRIFENTRAADMQEKENFCEVSTPLGRVCAKCAIVATNTPFYDPDKVFSRLQHLNSFVVAARPVASYPEAMLIGTENSDMSFRPHKDNGEEWLIVGERHDETGGGRTIDEHFDYVAGLADEHLGIKRIAYKWGAADTRSLDGIPYIGKMPKSKNIYVTTGFSAWGMTTSFVSAKVLADLILEVGNEWESLYTPARLTA